MSIRNIVHVLVLTGLAAVLLIGCQPVTREGAATQQAGGTEEMKAAAAAQELNTFDLMIARNWDAYDAVTDPDFYQVGSDGGYVERDAMLAGLNDDKLVVHKPELGELRVEMITPDAYMVTYPLYFNGSYDGKEFSNPRTVASLWVWRDGKWQNRFLVDQIRTAEFKPAASASAAETDLATEIDTRLTNMAAKDFFNGVVLIARDGKVLLNKGYGTANRELAVPMHEATKFRIGSLTSLFTALAVMRLVQDGAVSLDSSICTYIDNCPAAWQPITIDHLLARTSGLRPFESVPGIAQARKVGAAPAELIKLYREQPLDAQPGQRWNYSAMNDILLGLVVEKAGGGYAAFVQKNILDPLALKDTGVDHSHRLLDDRAAGYANAYALADPIDIGVMGAAGALYSTVGDLYRLEEGLASGAILSDTSAAQMTAPHTQISNFYGGSADYGYGWFRKDYDGHDRLIATGGVEGYMADMHVFPEDKLVVIVLGNRDDQDTFPTSELIEGWILGGK